MDRITITCPACGHSRAVDEAAVPAGPVQVTCPQCRGAFMFTKGTGVAQPGSGASAAPSAPGQQRLPPPKSGARSPASTRQRKAPPPARSRRKVLAVTGAVVCGAVVLGAAWMSVFQVTPIVKEKVLIAALFSKIPPVQMVAIRALRDYPTRHVAVSLVLFINLKNLQWVPDPQKPVTPEERVRRREVRRRDLKLAERATETLCLLTGESFGTYFKLEKYAHSWGSLSEEKWAIVLRQIDAWALQTLGGVELPMFGSAAPETPPQPAAASGAGEAR